MNKKTTIKVDNETKESLNSLKIHFRETYEDVIIRLIKNYKSDMIKLEIKDYHDTSEHYQYWVDIIPYWDGKSIINEVAYCLEQGLVSNPCDELYGEFYEYSFELDINGYDDSIGTEIPKTYWEGDKEEIIKDLEGYFLLCHEKYTQMKNNNKL